MGNTVAKEHFDSTHREIVSQVHLLSDSDSIVNIVNGVGLYDINSDVLGVYAARWQLSSATNDFSELQETNKETIEQDDRSWLKQTASVPTHFALDGSQLQLYPLPTVNSDVNGYPRVIMRVDKASTLNTNAAMPAAVPSHDAWKYGMAMRHTEETADPRHDMYAKSFYRALSRLQNYRFTKNRYIQGPVVKSQAFFNNPRVK